MKYSSRLILLVASMALPNLLLGVISFMQRNQSAGFLFCVFGLLGLLATLLTWYKLNAGYAGEAYQVISIKRFNFDMFSHIISYLPSLIAFGLGSGVEIYALTIFYLFYIFIISMSDIVVLNPILHWCGWRFRGVTLKFEQGTEDVVVMTKPKADLVLGDAYLKELSDFGMYLLYE